MSSRCGSCYLEIAINEGPLKPNIRHSQKERNATLDEDQYLKYMEATQVPRSCRLLFKRG